MTLRELYKRRIREARSVEAKAKYWETRIRAGERARVWELALKELEKQNLDFKECVR